MTTRTRGRSRLARKLSWLVVASMITVALAVPGAVSVSAAEPVAVYTSNVNTDLAGNPSCNAVELLGYSNGQDWVEFKLDGADVADGTTIVGNNSITITNFDSGLPTRGFSWTSNFGVDAVIIKTGNGNGGYNTLAVYAPFASSPEATSGSVTTESPTGISHISFCWDKANPTATPTVAPTASPTVAPTASPTEAPTATPTVAPTASPTVAPTATPTVAPTEAPTATPTATPTVAPTEAPTATPTVAPTATPPDGGVGGATGTPTPTGGVGGATGTPAVTLPPTDTLGAGAAPSGDSWRMILLAMAGLLAAALLLTPATNVTVAAKKDRR